MPKLTTEPSRCGVVEGMIFSRLSPNGVRRMRMAPSPRRDYSRGLTLDTQLAQFIYNRLTYIDAFQGKWSDRPEHGARRIGHHYTGLHTEPRSGSHY